jgi:hypothetical protein
MTDEDIEQLIDALNRGEMREYVFRTCLSSNVDFAKVWCRDPVGGIMNEGSYDFFFIKNENGKYIGAVSDMHNDLHAFVKKLSRKRGYLKKAMDEIILPKLYQSGRKKQRVTFEDPSMGDYCVKHLGFTLTGSFEAEKDLSVYSDVLKIVGCGTGLSKEEFRDIHIKIGRAKLYLSMICEQLEMGYNSEYDSSHIFEIKRQLGRLENEIEVFFIKSKKPDKST